jgi:hypothetical protein
VPGPLTSCAYASADLATIGAPTYVVLTRSGFHTMPSGRGDRGNVDDVSVAVSGPSFSRVRDPPEAPDDLKAALTDPTDDEFGTKIFMTLEIKDFEPSPVTTRANCSPSAVTS